MMRKLREVIVVGALLAVSTTAAANMIYTWTADGTTESAAQQATAVFNFSSANSFTLTLTNNASPTEFLASELDGFTFSFSTTPLTLILDSVYAPFVINCTAAVTAPCPDGAGSTPYGWGAEIADSQMTLGAGHTSAGDFSFHPYGIVNQNYKPAGLNDPAYNPLLVGPVTYTFSMTGMSNVPEIQSASFLFGTVPDRITGIDPPSEVPEPRSLALISIGMLALVWGLRRGRRIS